MQTKILAFSIRHPKTVFITLFLLCAVAIAAMFKVKVDTDPENMLSHDNYARQIHDQVKQQFLLSEMLVLGVINDTDKDGVYNPQTLSKLHQLSEKVKHLDGVIYDDLMSLSTSDNITQTADGQIQFHRILDGDIKSSADALKIKQQVKRLPMLENTLVSGDNKAAGIYLPITAKDQSYRLYGEIQEIIATLEPGNEQYHITGLPVAEDTFGVEMFKQMAISAPAAGLLIFVIMLFFFRSVQVVIAPMIVAMATVILSMGLMIGSGFAVHIMSSMIPIFLMPIAVVNSIHMLSNFTDKYKKDSDAKQLITDSVRELFRPMLFTSVTSLIGFASLNTADIPPVKVFGSFVAIGIAIAFLLTIIFIPAYVSVMSKKQLSKMASRIHKSESEQGMLGRFLEKMPAVIERYSASIIAFMAVVLGISIWGITKINVNDNPMNWFQSDHPIRKADKELNAHFAGTYQAFLSFDAPTKGIEDIGPKLVASFEAAPASAKQRLDDIIASAKTKQNAVEHLAEEVMNEQFAASEDASTYWDQALNILENEQQKPFLEPENLAYIEKLQQALAESEVVGKTLSVVDMLKTVNRELQGGKQEHYALPQTVAQAQQSIITMQSSHNPKQVWHMITPDYHSTVLWLQLKSGDNQDMNKVVEHAAQFFDNNPPPNNIEQQWSGLTYINVIWQDTMVKGMLASLGSSFVIVALMMIVLFRSLIWGMLAMLPLTLTIALIYGLIGITGKNYDMPVAVLSALTLGMSVDFAIHFIERGKLVRNAKNWRRDLQNVFAAPGRAIARNAIVIALGFTPLLLAPLVPYQTVGVFMALIMGISCMVTLVLLPAISYQFNKLLFR